MSTAPPTEAPPEPPPERSPRKRFLMAPRVFIPAAAFVIGFVLLTVLLPSRTEEAINWLQAGIIDSVGWYYILLVAGFVVFSIVLAVSRFGNIKLGRDDEPAEFKLGTWLAMLFSAGMGIGLVFWGVAEPLWHLADPRPGATGSQAPDYDPNWYQAEGAEGAAAEAASQALPQTFIHWGVHAWAIYVIVGLAIAYAVFRKGRPVSIRWALEPVLGKYVRGWLGDLVDILAIVGTIFGVATSLGLGALQIGAGMEFLGWVDEPGDLVTVLLIGSITLVATLSVMTGLKRGIKWLSQINVSMAGVLLIFVLIAGPTVFIFREYIQSSGQYLQQFFQLSFDVGAEHGESGEAWQSAWTTFYWGWWISWAPFVGIFIARISRGRTVREFITGVLLVPTVVSFLWFSALGGTAIYSEVFGDGGLVDPADGPSTVGALFQMLDGLPVAGILITLISIMVIILIATFFVTSSDSGSFVVDMLASGGDPDPPTWSRVFWAVLEGLVAIALLVLITGEQGGLEALQTAAIIAALPFSLVMLAMCVSIWKQFGEERREWQRLERERRTKELTAHVTQSMIDDGLIEPNGNGGEAATDKAETGPTRA
ncbi:BCCT family transporter [Natronosporangium hydrolyticum]|uniref:BCCT family transporter n=1 Tax=Natronosporangium hydrolyticum TaxID=2811111 RepID=A0A895YD94_9ACTN|nr:BCCT family transporter [Natronosporangium hydrolyticum]QSB13423.1 BCCT family transporter [Natronosporangium hydrolyticum]